MLKVISSAVESQTVKLIENSLRLSYINQYTRTKTDLSNHSRFTDNLVTDNCCSFYGPMVCESLLSVLQPKAEEFAGAELVPTYSYARLYWQGAVMKRHTDRPSCEISASLNISIDPDPWTIFFSGTGYDLFPGDLVFYEGCKIEHWRDPYQGKEQIQVFLHWVRKDGSSAEWAYDKRPGLGFPPIWA